MELTALTVKDFTALLSSDAPAPGGGSASALMGALGAALAGMVCALSRGTQTQTLQPELRALSDRFLRLVEEDTAAFELVSAGYRLPKATAEEKEARSAAIQAGLKECLRTPTEMMQLCAQTLRLADDGMTQYNTSAASDLGVAALCLHAAARGAWMNVRINLQSLKDAAFATACRENGEMLLAQCEALSQRLLDRVALD